MSEIENDAYDDADDWDNFGHVADNNDDNVEDAGDDSTDYDDDDKVDDDADTDATGVRKLVVLLS